jgi:hypothetical protein
MKKELKLVVGTKRFGIVIIELVCVIKNWVKYQMLFLRG